MVRRCSDKYYAYNIKDNREICHKLQQNGGDLEYQENLLELRTQKGEEEYSPAEAQKTLQQKVDNLVEIVPHNYVHSCGTYQGQDDPNLDIWQNEKDMGKNAFWNEFNIVFPADALMRYTAADHINISMHNTDLHPKLYNCLLGLSPIFIYAFSLSPCIHGRNVSVWSRRQQLINAMEFQSNVCLPNTFPLTATSEYTQALEQVITKAEQRLRRHNPFFTQDGLAPREVIRKYRGSLWGFYKLFTNQTVRFNQQNGYPEYLEVRCIDAQECTKATVAISYLLRKVAQQLHDLWPIITHNEDELRRNVHEATIYGEKANIHINGSEVSLPEYAQRVLEQILQEDASQYAAVLRERFLFPPAKIISQYIEQQGDIIPLLSRCLRENKTLKEML